MVGIGFDPRLSPVGVPLHARVRLGHRALGRHGRASILAEAHELVEKGLLTEADFRDFTFTNPAMLHLRVNPRYFDGTVLEREANALLAGVTPRPGV